MSALQPRPTTSWTDQVFSREQARHGPFPVTTAARTLIDLCRDLSELDAGGRLVQVVDGYLCAQAMAFEADGRITFTDPYGGKDPAAVLWAEKRAEDELRALGIRVARPTMVDVGSGWRAFEARIAREVAAPVPPLQPFTAVQREVGRLRPPTSRG